MNASTQYAVTPIGTLLSDKQLLNGRVQYRAFAQYQVAADEANNDLLHTGIITTAHTHPVHGLMVRIMPDENTLDLVAGWYALSQVTGWAVIASEDTPAVVVMDQPAVVTVQTVETPVAAQPAHMTDAGRVVGTLGYVSIKSGYGFIDYTDGDFVDSVKFDTRNVFGGTQAVIALMSLKKGTQVSFAHGTAKSAVAVVIPGNEKSESHYASYMDIKARKTAAPLPRARRNRDINARVVRPQA
jgi:hypothetical protein